MFTGTTASATAVRDALRRCVLDPVLAAVFPTACVACRFALDEPSLGALCTVCYHALPRFDPPLCRCGAALGLAPSASDPQDCGRCRRGLTAWTRGACIGPFDGSLRLAIHALKYGRRERLARRLAGALVESAGSAHVLDGASVLVPVPLHRSRETERGYNQSALVADALARRTRIPFDPGALVRRRPTPPQTGLTAFARRRNMAGAFEIRHRQDLSLAGAVVLVDDVMTTGATATACATALLRAGAKDVRLLTLARVA